MVFGLFIIGSPGGERDASARSGAVTP